MSDDVSAVRKVIGVEEHAWTAELRDALVKFGGDDTVTMMSAQAGIDRRLLDVSDGRLARMDAAGVDMEILSITTPGTQPLRPAEAVPLARDANDFLADAVRAHPGRFAAFVTLPTPEPEAAAGSANGTSISPQWPRMARLPERRTAPVAANGLTHPVTPSRHRTKKIS